MSDTIGTQDLLRDVEPTPRVVISGHEAFAPRHGWLVKLYHAVRHDPDLFRDDDNAVLGLGIGRNMVRSLRFWGVAFGLLPSSGVARSNDRSHHGGVTLFADALLNPGSGLDPYLDEIGSLWRLHWVLSTRANLGAWSVLSELGEPEITRADLVARVLARARSNGRATERTAANHVDVFLRMYDATSATDWASWEDGLGSPFQDLDFLRTTRRGGLPVASAPFCSARPIDARSTAFIIADYWHRNVRGGTTLSLRAMLLEARAPGTILRLDEIGLHALLRDMCDAAPVGTLREDGLGGINLVMQGADDAKVLEDWAWNR
ncbi:MAG: DUF4007 family protein [Rhodobacteraceae bacterium]|nr:DUF4007 family protein [Paracoccaceae bacterium]